jgi:hypothetical protein
MHKCLKHILSFFLLLTQQLIFASSFANVCFGDDNVVGRIEFSDKVTLSEKDMLMPKIDNEELTHSRPRLRLCWRELVARARN